MPVSFHAGWRVALLLVLAIGPFGCRSSFRRNGQGAEERAVAFLAHEVPAWSRENGCFSCHNNGDAARALYAARRLGFKFARTALVDTSRWLSQPSRWEHNRGDPGFSDQRLANLQFAAALLAVEQTRPAAVASSLPAAAARVVADQDSLGAWPIETQDSLGSPATYGTTLATYTAWRVLMLEGSKPSRHAANRAGEWLRRAPMRNVPAAGALLQFAMRDSHPSAPELRARAFDFLHRAQTSDGGWGPYPAVPAEAFDTAVALLALAELPREPGLEVMIKRGRDYLVSLQLADGSWPATTRPSGGESYAQKMSTTGWATQALLVSGDSRPFTR